MKIKDVMSTEVASISPETPLREVAIMLAERGFSGLPVVDDAGQVVGVVSEADILHKEREAAIVEEHGLSRITHRGRPAPADPKQTATTAGEAMTSPAVVTSPETPVSKAASVMLDRKINRLPVVDHGKLVGIVSRADLIRAFARSDDEVRSEVEELVAYQIGLWNLRPKGITATVADGAVTLDGEVDTPDQVQRLVGAIGRTPGVVSVEANLTARFKDDA